MKSTGMVRQVDKMGRVVIPKEIRAQLKIENNVDSFEIFMEGDKIILQKYFYELSIIFYHILHKSHQKNRPENF